MADPLEGQLEKEEESELKLEGEKPKLRKGIENYKPSVRGTKIGFMLRSVVKIIFS